ncbi:hypothetical protein QQ045_000660 [Rhodiola kirilowii]
MANVNTSLLVTCLALIILCSYEIEVCEGTRAFRAKETTTIALPAPGLNGMGHVADHGDKNRHLTEIKHVEIHSRPVAYYGAEEANETQPGHSPGAGHSTGPGAATPVISN